MTRCPGKTGSSGPPADSGAERKNGRRNGEAGPDAGGTVVLLGALCLFLSTLEYLIPKPLPFIRIGLANLPLMLALDLLSPRYFSLLVFIKIIGAGIVGGTIFSYVFIFSLLGSAASALVMYSLRRIGAASGKADPAKPPKRGPRLSLAGIGVAGAMCSTGVQLFLARFLVFGEGVRYLIPPFLAVSLVTGCALGLFCEHFCRRSRWYRKVSDLAAGEVFPAGGPPPPLPRPAKTRREQRRELRRNRWDQRFNDSELIVAGFIALLLFLFNPSVPGRFLQFLFFYLCAWLSGRKNNPLITFLVIAGIAAVNLLVPYGRVLAEIGLLPVTAGSLADGFRKGITLEGLVMLSTAVIRGKLFSGASGLPGEGSGQTGSAAPPRPAVFRRAAVFGRFLGGALSVFAVLREGRGRVRPGHLIEDVDALLLELDETPVPGRRAPGQEKTGAAAPAAGQGPSRGSAAGRGRLWLVVGLLITAALMAGPPCFT